MPDGGDLLSTAEDVGTNVVAPAAVGAGTGALTAAITGGDPGQGALIGAGTGAVGGGANWALGGPNYVAQALGIDSGGGTPATLTDTTGGGGGTAPITTMSLTPPGGGASAASVAPSFGGAGGLGPDQYTTDLTSQQLDASGNPIGQSAAGAILGGKPDIGGGGSAGGGAVPVTDASGNPLDQSAMNAVTGGKPDVPAQPGLASRVLSSLGLGGDALGKNPLGTLVSGGGLLYAASRNQNPQGMGSLKSEAQGLEGDAGTLTSPLLKGTALPPGAQAAIDQAARAEKARIRAKYASLGMSGSTSEIQEMTNVDQNIAALTFQTADTLFKQGLDMTKLSSDIYSKLVNLDMTQSGNIGKAIANFAGALAGSGVRQPTDQTAAT